MVDDCSTDDTRDVLAACRDPRLRVIHAERNAGPVREPQPRLCRSARTLHRRARPGRYLPARSFRAASRLSRRQPRHRVGCGSRGGARERQRHIEHQVAGDHARADRMAVADRESVGLVDRHAAPRRGAAGRLHAARFPLRRGFRSLSSHRAQLAASPGSTSRYCSIASTAAARRSAIVDTMQANATRVLAENYAIAGSADPHADARLIVDLSDARHAGARPRDA